MTKIFLFQLLIFSFLFFHNSKAQNTQLIKKKFESTWLATEILFSDTSRTDKEKEKAKKDLRSKWLKIKKTDIAALENQFIEFLYDYSICYLGNGKGCKPILDSIYIKRNSNIPITKFEWRDFNNYTVDLYVLDEMYWESGAKKSRKISRPSYSHRNFPLLNQRILNVQVPKVNGAKIKLNEENFRNNWYDRMLFVTNGYIKEIDTVIRSKKVRIDSIMYEPSNDTTRRQFFTEYVRRKGYWDLTAQAWGRNNRKLISVLTEYLDNYIANKPENACGKLKEAYELYYKLGKSVYHQDRIKLRHYKSLYDVDFRFIYDLIEACECNDLKKYAASNFWSRKDTLSTYSNLKHPSAPRYDISKLVIKEKIIDIKEDLEEEKEKEKLFINTWKAKLDFLSDHSIQNIEVYSKAVKNFTKDNLSKEKWYYNDKNVFVRHPNNFHLERELAFLLDEYYFKYLENRAETNRERKKLLERAYKEAYRLFKSINPEDRIKVRHYEKYYNITYDVVLDIIRTSSFSDLIKTINDNEVSHKNEFRHFSMLKRNGYQLNEIQFEKLDSTHLTTIEHALIPTLNAKLQLFNADLQKENVFDFTEKIRKVINDCKQYFKVYKRATAKDQNIQALYDLDMFYFYVLSKKYEHKEANHVNNARRKLPVVYSEISEDFRKGHPLNKARSNHYRDHYGISLEKLNQIVDLNKANINNLVIKKEADIVREPSLIHPGTKYEVGNYKAENVLDALRQKWALESDLINTEINYIKDYNSKIEKLKKEHVTISNWQNSKVVKDTFPVRGYYSDDYYITEFFEEYLVKDLINCQNMKYGLFSNFKNKDCEKFKWLSGVDLDITAQQNVKGGKIESKEVCFGLSEIKRNDIFKSSGCCGKASIPIKPNITFTTSSNSIREDGRQIVDVKIKLSNAYPKKIQIPIVLKGNAVIGKDYKILNTDNRSGNLNIAANTTEASLKISVLDNKVIEGSRLLKVNLGDPVNAVIESPQTYKLLIEDDDDLQVRVLERLQSKLDKGYNDGNINIEKAKNLIVKGAHGTPYVFTISNETYLKEVILFQAGRYSIKDENMHGGSKANDHFEKYREAMLRLKNVLVDILDKNVSNDDAYQIFIRGSADIAWLSPRPLNDNTFPIDVIKAYKFENEIKLGDGKLQKVYSTDHKRFDIGTNSYNKPNNIKSCSHGADYYCNCDLPHMRGYFLKSILSDYLDFNKERITLLEGMVTPKVNPEDRNCTVIIYIDWDKAKGI